MFPRCRSFFLVFISLALASGCSQNDSQREFEREAFSLPGGITQTNERGEIVNGNQDPDDWRIAPFFQGIVFMENFPHPNPVLTNDNVIIEFSVVGFEAVSGMRIFVLDAGTPRHLQDGPFRPLPPGLNRIDLNPLRIARFPENPQGVYRIIITDDYNENVITYGDIEIQ